MSSKYAGAQADHASFAAGGAYNNPNKEVDHLGRPLPKVVQPTPPTVASARSLRLQLLDLIGEANRRSLSVYGPEQRGMNPSVPMQQMSDGRLLQLFGHVANLYLIGNEHTASGRATGRQETRAVLAELEAMAGGHPYRGPASVGRSYALEPSDEDMHPTRCCFCGGEVRWRDVRVMNEFLAQPGARISDMHLDAVAHVACWVPRSEVTP